MSRESRCKMPRICRAPSDVFAAGAAACTVAGLETGMALCRVSPSSVIVASYSSPRNSRLKKHLNARTIRFNPLAPVLQDSLDGLRHDVQQAPPKQVQGHLGDERSHAGA